MDKVIKLVKKNQDNGRIKLRNYASIYVDEDNN